ncbi:Ras-related protein Rac [Acrasis kona]|uniref:Ras-related protein Rac n=1 Tax=Acrasis kona TaxID=1008807 RepID=A0AAW2YLD1_9EUKA
MNTYPQFLRIHPYQQMLIGKQLMLHCWDTAGQEDYDLLRPLSYPMTDVFLLCFSIVNETSRLNVSRKWVPELQHYSPNSKIILVGTKSDLRNDEKFIEKLTQDGLTITDMSLGEVTAKEINAVKYVECSAKDKESVNAVFTEGLRSALIHAESRDPNVLAEGDEDGTDQKGSGVKEKKKKKSCTIL